MSEKLINLPEATDPTDNAIFYAVDGNDRKVGKIGLQNFLDISGINTGDQDLSGLQPTSATLNSFSNLADAGGVLTNDGFGVLSWQAVSGTGTVTSVAIATANGVSGSVANAATTPAITITLGAITPTSVAASGTVTGSNLAPPSTNITDPDGARTLALTDANQKIEFTHATASVITVPLNASVDFASAVPVFETFIQRGQSAGPLSFAAGPTINNNTLSDLPQGGFAVLRWKASDEWDYIGSGVVDWEDLTGTPTTLMGYGISPIVNADIDASAAIAVTKLALPGGSTNFLREDGTWAAPSGGGGGGSTIPVVKTANYTAVSGDVLDANTTGGAFTVTLPATPAAGALVTLYDSTGSWGTNNLTIGRNSSTIDGSAADYTLRKSSRRVQFLFNGTTWAVYFSSQNVDVQVFTSSGTYYKPPGGYRYEVILVGGGHGGGSGMRASSGDAAGGGGAAGGAVVVAEGFTADISATEAVTVGAGGAGGAARTGSDISGAPGTNGGPSRFSVWGTYNGAAPAGGGNASTGVGGAAGGAAINIIPSGISVNTVAGGAGNVAAGTAGVATAFYGGGAGGGGGITSSTLANGGAGGAWTTTRSLVSGVNLPGGTGGIAGGANPTQGTRIGIYQQSGSGGGASSLTTAQDGAAGLFPGGGGGGGGASRDTSGAGGTGAGGLVIITTFCSF